MYIYTLGQWLLFFFLLLLLRLGLGVLLRLRQAAPVGQPGLSPRPLLPIYGTGAVIILLAAIPVRENPALVFLLGMLAATALEYVTGAAMEALFKVRYWDYSKQPFNLHGHICLTCSVAWGAFSVLLVRFLHPPVEDLVLRLPAFLADALACVLTVVYHCGRRPLLPGRHGPAGGPHPAHRGERGPAAACPAGGGVLRLCRG